MTYYWKDDVRNDVYHWHTTCHINQYPASGWEKGSSPPSSKTEQCNHCKAIDKKQGG